MFSILSGGKGRRGGGEGGEGGGGGEGEKKKRGSPGGVILSFQGYHILRLNSIRAEKSVQAVPWGIIRRVHTVGRIHWG